MPQDRLGHLTIARGATALFQRIVMNRKPRRIDTQFNELSSVDVSSDDVRGDSKVVTVLSMHLDAVYQLVTVGKLLRVEFLLQ